jgi:hypothetical protein
LADDRSTFGLTDQEIVMFKTNEGTVDRALRIIVGIGLLLWFFMGQGEGFWHYAKLIGIVPLATGLTGWCPPYSLLGINTCKNKNP